MDKGTEEDNPDILVPPPSADVPNPPTLVVGEPSVEDRARVTLAYIFAATIAFACVAVLINHNAWPNSKELLPIIMPAETALLAAVGGSAPPRHRGSSYTDLGGSCRYGDGRCAGACPSGCCPCE